MVEQGCTESIGRLGNARKPPREALYVLLCGHKRRCVLGVGACDNESRFRIIARNLVGHESLSVAWAFEMAAGNGIKWRGIQRARVIRGCALSRRSIGVDVCRGVSNIRAWNATPVSMLTRKGCRDVAYPKYVKELRRSGWYAKE